MNKLGILAVAIASLWATQVNATTIELGTGSTYYLGDIVTGIPSSEANEQAWVNKMITMGTETTDTLLGSTLTRSANTFPFLPAATYAARKDAQDLDWDYTEVNLSGYQYVLAKYGGGPGGGVQHSAVYYIGGVNWSSDTISLPNGTLSHYTLFRGFGVPDGGMTLLLLGSALAGLGYVRNRFGK